MPGSQHMEIDIDSASKAIANVATAISKILPVIRDWRLKKKAEPAEVEVVSEAVDSIQQGIDMQKSLAYRFRPLIYNYGLASQLSAVVDKIHEFCNENAHLLEGSTDIAKGQQHAVKQMLDDIARFEVVLLRKILEDALSIGRAHRRDALKKSATAISSDVASLTRLFSDDKWQLGLIMPKLKAMRIATLEIVTALDDELNDLVDVLAYAKF